MCTGGSKETGGERLGQKGISVGMGGIEVDGMDGLGVYEGRLEAGEGGVAGEGGSVMESLTYGYGGHTMG
ncbi:thiamine pyrophosphate-dependent enzyme, partial [Staphylococcus epidermidis]|uniref:thiamine pyrophosphate-dependent enzyme n=1 Tax=Staphylococcus epidermidis TaxID=1282 RepID=UPI0021B38A94